VSEPRAQNVFTETAVEKKMGVKTGKENTSALHCSSIWQGGGGEGKGKKPLGDRVSDDTNSTRYDPDRDRKGV